MYHVEFFRTYKQGRGFEFREDMGYGVFVDGIEYAIAKTIGNDTEWDITEVSTGLTVSASHGPFPTRDSALKWLKEYTRNLNVEERLEKYSHVQRALQDYKIPRPYNERKQVGNIVLTAKQTDFMHRYKKAKGTDDCPTKEVAGAVNLSPMSVGAQISTLVEKGVFETYLEGKIRVLKLTEIGKKMMEEIQ